jgi:hypothetical protein
MSETAAKTVAAPPKANNIHRVGIARPGTA